MKRKNFKLSRFYNCTSMLSKYELSKYFAGKEWR
jgi:hypothetical protein